MKLSTRPELIQKRDLFRVLRVDRLHRRFQKRFACHQRSMWRHFDNAGYNFVVSVLHHQANSQKFSIPLNERGAITIFQSTNPYTFLSMGICSHFVLKKSIRVIPRTLTRTQLSGAFCKQTLTICNSALYFLKKYAREWMNSTRWSLRVTPACVGGAA